jgi:hypothetical protein
MGPSGFFFSIVMVVNVQRFFSSFEFAVQIWRPFLQLVYCISGVGCIHVMLPKGGNLNVQVSFNKVACWLNLRLGSLFGCPYQLSITPYQKSKD